MKIYLIDDHAIVRNGLKTILASEPELEVIGDTGNADDFLNNIAKIKADLFIIDISLPTKSGFEILKEIKIQHPQSKTIMLSMHDNYDFVTKAKDLGANGFLSKKLDSQVLLQEIINITHGKDSFENTSSTDVDANHPLTQREKEILINISKGKSSKEIATALNISQRTVEAHRFNITRKMGTANMSEAVAKFINSSKINI